MKILNSKKIVVNENVQKFRIFVDMDGILSDWLSSACESCGVDINDQKTKDLLKDGKELQELGIVSEDELWDHINKAGQEWWEDLDILPHAKKLIAEMQKLGTVCILTSPGKVAKTGAFASAGKVLWMTKHFPDIPYIIAYEKGLCATEASILIDDSEKKIKMFEDHGGKGFLWPVQYVLDDNEVEFSDLIEQIKQKIEEKE